MQNTLDYWYKPDEVINNKYYLNWTKNSPQFEWLDKIPQKYNFKKKWRECSIHLEALITVHVHKGLYLGNRFIDIAQI